MLSVFRQRRYHRIESGCPQNIVLRDLSIMSEPITAAVSDRICKHMNQDHADAVLMYARVYGKAITATAATMDAIDSEGMNLNAEVEDATVPLRIIFDRPLADAKDAHLVLVEMLKQPQADG
jgi:putative heme iron utilization protein